MRLPSHAQPRQNHVLHWQALGFCRPCGFNRGRGVDGCLWNLVVVGVCYLGADRKSYFISFDSSLLGGSDFGAGMVGFCSGMRCRSSGRVFAGWPQMTVVPVVFVAGGLFTYCVDWLFVTLVTTHSPASLDEVSRNYATYLAIPLGIYWGITDGPFALLDVIRRWIRSRSARPGISVDR